jgi:hypothetical protein
MRKILLSFLAVLTVGAASGCGDAPTAPAAPAPQPEARQALLGLVALTPVLQRRQPLPANITVKARIGAEGGVIAIPEAGLRVVVPRGAVSAPVEFTATALAGRAVAYEFAPHGITFANKLVVTQELRGTEWIGLPLLNMRAGYFKDASDLDTQRALVKLTEILPLSVDLLRLQVRFNVSHFSGYVISTGRAQAVSDE